MHLARNQEFQPLLTVPVRLLGKSLPGCASFPLYKRHTCLWKTIFHGAGQTFEMLFPSVLSWEQESLPVWCPSSGSAEHSLSALLHPGFLCLPVYVS